MVWSQSDDAPTGSASRSTTHGGFDNDPATMESAARRILGLRDGEPIEPFPSDAQDRSSGDFWTGQVDWPADLLDLFQAAQGGIAVPTAGPGPGIMVPVGGGVQPVRPAGNRSALCIGINDYPRDPLPGCVADARLWARTLSEIGYRTELLLDGAATTAAILEKIRTAVTGARPGGNLVMQFSGHGTQFADRDGDEAGGDTPVTDEYLCAVDLDDPATGGLVIDDELRAIFDASRDDVTITCFFDCCHSGTSTRAALRD